MSLSVKTQIGAKKRKYSGEIKSNIYKKTISDTSEILYNDVVAMPKTRRMCTNRTMCHQTRHILIFIIFCYT